MWPEATVHTGCRPGLPVSMTRDDSPLSLSLSFAPISSVFCLFSLPDDGRGMKTAASTFGPLKAGAGAPSGASLEHDIKVIGWRHFWQREPESKIGGYPSPSLALAPLPAIHLLWEIFKTERRTSWTDQQRKEEKKKKTRTSRGSHNRRRFGFLLLLLPLLYALLCSL